MFAVNAVIESLAILTKAVIPLALSEILPEAGAETEGRKKFDIKQMENGEISQIAKTSSTFGARWAKN